MFGAIRSGRRIPSNPYRDQAKDDILAWIFIAICGVFILVVNIDRSSQQRISTIGSISDKIFIPAHHGQTSTGAMYDVPNDYLQEVSFDGFRQQFNVDSKQYNRIKIGDKVNVIYLKSVIFNSITVIFCSI